MTVADLTLFLDFDGVLHPLWEPPPHNDWTLEQIHGRKDYAGPFLIYAPVLVDLLRPYLPHLDIVISSLWARKRGLPILKSLLPLELADRVSDAIYHHGPASRVSRWMDIAIYRRDTRPDIGDRWLAIDHDNGGWPAEAAKHLAHCNRPLNDSASRQAVEDALLLLRQAHPFAVDRAAMEARGLVPGAVGLDDSGNLVQRGEDGQLYPLQAKE